MAGIRKIFRTFWPATRPYRGRLLLSLLLVAVGPFLDTAQIWMYKLLIDDVLVPRNFAAFPLIAAAYVGIALAQGVGSFCDEMLSTWLGERFVLDLRTRLFDHLHRLPVDFLDRRQLGDTLSRLTGDIDAIEALVLSGVTRTLAYLFEILLFTGALFYLNWRLALAAMLAAPVFALAARYFSGRIKDASREQRRRSGSVTAVAEESLGNVALVQAYDRHTAVTEWFHQESASRFVAEMAATRLRALFRPLTELLEVVGVVAVMGMGVWALQHDEITLGGLLVFLTYLTRLYSPIRGAGRLSNTVYAASASAERIIDLLGQQPDIQEPAQPRSLHSARGRLVFHGVSFCYPGAVRPAVKNITFAIAPGQTVALVGASGAGKSTLGKLVLRFHDPDTGRITLDGYDLRNLTLTDLRSHISAVLQETLVFDGTIRDNILWGKPDATDADVMAAATAADAHEFITALPEGYQTRIGQRGRLLSGGQRQRLAIARAMIRDAPVLLLDEPTTGLDAASTQRVLAPMRRLMAGRTTLIISHNLLTVTDADQILFLRDGRITGAGTHHDLLASNADYAHLYRLHHQPRLQPELI
ncbi:MAG TPA: ABC transporter ATP-binding protein [Pseudonocardiaceae bacterium]|nr:ABC transporter ATP-binding protein [Pseudonocardiaceae bacterium]